MEWIMRGRRIPGNWLERAMAYRVVVHTTASETVSGNLTAITRDGLALSGAELFADEGTVPMAGVIFIPREKVHFVQVIPPDGDWSLH